MTRFEQSLRQPSGYSITELLFAVGLLMVLTSMAIVQINATRPALKGDGAMRVVLGQLTQARETAITQRRYVRVVLTAPNQVQTVSEDSLVSLTTLTSALMEGGARFTLIDGLPDTPDKFGNDSAIAFGTALNVKFTPEGALVNQDGSSVNGTAFLALPNQALSARAITILGSTGRIRGYRWNGSRWTLV
jgi:Tfp pilus assembly protein FimT